MNKEGTKRRLWHRIVAILQCVVLLVTIYAMVLPALTMERVLSCGQEEHMHDNACYEKVLTCPLEEGHTHTDACYEQVNALACGISAHTHGDGCYDADGNLTCTQQGHIHTSACLAQQRVLTCTKSAGHVHTDGCFTQMQILQCEVAEHTHGKECYDADGNLTCTQTEHTHTDECYTAERVLTCTQSESEQPEGHVHTDACYKIELTCGNREHTHSDNCYSDIKADVEDADDWEDTLPDEKELNGEWPHDVVAVAESQLDYTESVANWQIGEDGETHKGYTRYGAWFGAPYADWCAMFASFCLHYAGVPEEAIAYNASCPGWVEELKEAENFVSPDADYVPQPGDLLFLNFDPADQEETDEEETGEVAAERTAQHVAIVKELDEEHQVLYAYEGNSNNKVQVMAYLLPGYVEPTEEEQQDLPEEERFHTPEISMQLHEKSIVGYGSLQLIKETFDKKYPDGLNPEDKTDDKTDDKVSGNDVIDNVVDVNVNDVADDAAENGVSAQALPGNTEAYGYSRRVVLKAMIDGEWQVVGTVNGYNYENGSAYITTDQVVPILSKYGFNGGNAGQNFGYAMPQELYYTFTPKTNSNIAMDVDLGNGHPDNGDNVHLWTLSGADNQVFKFVDKGNGHYNFTLLQSLKEGSWHNLNMNGASAVNGVNVHIWQDDTDSSRWSLYGYDDGTYSFRTGRNSNLAIDIPWGRAYPGVNIQLHQVNDSDAQRFNLNPTHVINNTMNSGNRIYLGTNNGSDVICYYLPSGNTWNQTADAYTGMSIENLLSVYVDPNNAAGMNGVRYVATGGTCTITGLSTAYTWAATNAAGEAHAVTASGTTVTINNVTETLYLYPSVISSGSRYNYSVTYKVFMDGEWKTVGVQPAYHYDGSQGRAWVSTDEAYQFLAPYGYQKNMDAGYSFSYSWGPPVYHIFWVDTRAERQGRTNAVIDVPGGNSSTTDPAQLAQLWEFEGTKNQAFWLDDVGDGFVAIRHGYMWGAMGALNMKGGGNANNTQIQFYNVWENDTSSQWRLDKSDYGTAIMSRNGNNQSIDCDGGDTTNGRKLHSWNFEGSNQYWDFVKTRLIYNWKSQSTFGDRSKVFLAPTNNSDIICYYIPQYKDRPASDPQYGTANGWTEMASGWPDVREVTNTIQVVDEEHRVYTDSQLAALEKRVADGGSATVTLDNVNGYRWVAVGADGTAFTGTTNTATHQTTFNFTNVWQSYQIVLSATNPEYRVGYYGWVKKLNTTSTGNENLAVFDTTGRILPQNGNHGTDRLLYLQLNGDGSVQFKDERTQLYADQKYHYMTSPKLENIDVFSSNDAFSMTHITVKTGNFTMYDSDDMSGIAFVSNPTQAGGKRILLTDSTYIELTYSPSYANRDIKLKTRFLDYDIMSQDQTHTSSDWHNRAINYAANMELNGGAMTNWDYPGQYLFGNANIGVYHAPDYLVAGDYNGQYTNAWGNPINLYKAPPDINNWAHNESGGTGAEGAYRLNASSNSNWRVCFFGIVKDTLAWNSTTNEYDLQFRDGIAHPKNLFNNIYRDGKHILNDYNLVFDRIGDSYTLRQVAGKGDNGYLKKVDNLNSSDMADLRCLTNVGGYAHIFSNNFWPLDCPSRWNWDGYSGDGNYDAGHNPNYRDRFYGSNNNAEGDNKAGGASGLGVHEVYKISSVAPIPGQEKIKFPASDDATGGDWSKGSAHNCLFGMNTEIEFTLDKNYVGPLDYLFFGDDDLWVYLIRKDGTALPNGQDTQLICDIGGVHSAAGEFVNLRNYLPDGSSGTYALKIFYTERGNSGSTCYMNFTLPSVGVPIEERNTSVSLQKLVDGGDTNKDFTFTFNAKDEAGNALTGDYSYAKVVNGTIQDSTQTIRNGSQISLKADESITIYGLPVGSNNTVTFTESNADGYISTPSMEGRSDYTVNGNSITFKLSDQGSQNIVTFVNTKTVSASVTKRVSAGGETNKDFQFKIITWDPAWQGHAGNYRFVVRNASGGYVTEGRLTNGEVVITLKHGQTATVEGIPLHWHIGFYEYSDSNYTTVWSGTGGKLDPANDGNDNLNGYVSDLDSATTNYTCTCTNTANSTTATLIKRVVNAPNGASDHEYTFEFRYCTVAGAWGEDGRDYPYEIYNGNGTQAATGILHYGSKVKLKADQRLVLSNVLPGYRLEFIEQPESNYYPYTATFSGKGLNHAPENSGGMEAWGRSYIAQVNGAENELICTNTYPYTSVSLQKVVNGINLNPNKDFHFYLLMWQCDGTWADWNHPLGGSYSYTLKSGATTVGTGTISDRTEFTLKAGQTITINGLPVGARIGFYEQPEDAYSTTWSSTGTNAAKKRNDGPLPHTKNWPGYLQELEANASHNAFTCTNTVAVTSATLKKVVTGTHADTNKQFNFGVRIWYAGVGDMPKNKYTFNYTITRASGHGNSTNGTLGDYDRFTLAAGDRITVTGLPVGANIGFYEEWTTGYATTWSGGSVGSFDGSGGWPGRWQNLTTANTTYSFTCTNESQYADLVVGKKVYGASIVTSDCYNDDFTFQICKGSYAATDQAMLNDPYIGAGVTYDIYTWKSGSTSAGIDGADAVYEKTGTGTTGANGVFTLEHNQKAVFHNLLPGSVRVVELLKRSTNPYTVHMSGDGGVTEGVNDTWGKELYRFTTKDANGNDVDVYTSNAFTIKAQGVYGRTDSYAASETKVRNRIVDAGMGIVKTVTAWEGSATDDVYWMNVKINGNPLPIGAWVSVKGGKEQYTLTEPGLVPVYPGTQTTIWNLRRGDLFEVVEKDAAANGYVPTYTVGGKASPGAGAFGIIELDLDHTEQIPTANVVHVTNAQQGTALDIPVRKTVSNPDDVSRNYQFSIYCWNSNPSSNVPVGTENTAYITIPTTDAATGNFRMKYLSKDFTIGTTRLSYRIDELELDDQNVVCETGIRYDVVVEVTKAENGTLSARIVSCTREINNYGNKSQEHADRADNLDMAEFTNTLLGDVAISKRLTDASGTDITGSQQFEFSATLTNASGAALSAADLARVEAKIGDTVVSVGTSGTFTFSLKAGQTINIRHLPGGAQCTVTETTSGYKTEVQNGGNRVEAKAGSITVTAGQTANLTFINTPIANNSVSLTKIVSGQGSEKGREFEFQPVVWKGGSDGHQWDYQSGDYTYTLYDASNNQYYRLTDKAGNYEPINTGDPQPISLQFTPGAEKTGQIVKLKDNWTFTLYGLANGVRAGFYEKATAGYVASWESTTQTGFRPDNVETFIGYGVLFDIAENSQSNPNINHVTCTNTTGTEIPQTGGIGENLFFGIGTLLMCCAGYLLLRRKRRDVTA